MKLNAGDTVRYRGEFLRSIGAFTGPLGQARGTITNIKPVGTLAIATVDWGRENVPEKVNVVNLEKCRRNVRAD